MSAIIPPELLPDVSNTVFNQLPPSVERELSVPASMSLAGPCTQNVEAHAELQRTNRRLIRLPTNVDLNHPPATTPPSPAPSTRTTPPIGNLFLSSCPGKKVRLTGPVGGRGTVCRDIDHDVARIASTGVGAIICCLDDTELAFLGVSWAAYEAAATYHDIDLIRLPLSEGYAPSDLRAFDRALTSIVLDYTLRGVPILAHCRGGVGRAGLFASAWMLKVGLVGCPTQHGGYEQPTISSGPDFRRNLAVAAQVIQAIRARRSPKAIETAEQVGFLVSYCAYLESQEAAAAAAGVTATTRALPTASVCSDGPVSDAKSARSATQRAPYPPCSPTTTIRTGATTVSPVPSEQGVTRALA